MLGAIKTQRTSRAHLGSRVDVPDPNRGFVLIGAESAAPPRAADDTLSVRRERDGVDGAQVPLQGAALCLPMVGLTNQTDPQVMLSGI